MDFLIIPFFTKLLQNNMVFLQKNIKTETNTDKKKNKPSREERGYTKARGKKDDWKQFFQGNNEFKDSEPDFSEEGWARRASKKKWLIVISV